MSDIDPTADPEASRRQVLAERFDYTQSELQQAKAAGDAGAIKACEAEFAKAQKALADSFKGEGK